MNGQGLALLPRQPLHSLIWEVVQEHRVPAARADPWPCPEGTSKDPEREAAGGIFCWLYPCSHRDGLCPLNREETEAQCKEVCEAHLALEPGSASCQGAGRAAG